MKRPTVQIVQHLRPGGIETLVLELQRLNHQHHPVHIVSLEGNLSDSIAQWPRLASIDQQLHFLNKSPGVSPWTLWKLLRLFRRLRPGAVHTHHTGPLLYGGVAARLAGIKNLIHTEHDAWHLESAKRLKLQRQLIRMLDPDLVADAQLVQRRCERLLPGSHFRLVHNGIDTEQFTPGDIAAARAKLRLPSSALIIGCAARLEKVKGLDLLLRAFRHLGRETYLVIAGQGTQHQQLLELAQQQGIQSRVKFLGAVDDMPTFYRALDLFCLASHREGLPLSPLEAQACDIPCVLTDAGGSKEALCPRTGILTPSGDIAGLVQALRQGLQHRHSNPTPDSPRRFVVEQRNIQRMARCYLSLSLPTQPV